MALHKTAYFLSYYSTSRIMRMFIKSFPNFIPTFLPFFKFTSMFFQFLPFNKFFRQLFPTFLLDNGMIINFFLNPDQAIPNQEPCQRNKPTNNS